MKTTTKAIALSLLFAIQPMSYAQKIESYSLDEVFQEVKETTAKRKLQIESGYYEAEGMNYSKKYEVLVEEDVNDKERKFFLFIDKKTVAGKTSSIGRIYHSRATKNGKNIMLSPLSVTNSGNVQIDSEDNPRSKVVLISKYNGNKGFSYLLKGQNGAFEGEIFKMKRKSKKTRNPKLSARSKHGFFASGSSRKGLQLMVVGDEISFYGKNELQNTYNLIDLNADGIFSGLVVSEFNAMSASAVSYERIQSLAVFFESYKGQSESVLVATPTFEPGEFRMSVYKNGSPSFLKKIWMNIKDQF
ncbi:hypothetical protein HBN50_03920 [Halobacteriovorax sp. GB3]|uniref:hypothetical protein n=1 Tax=Halobacteriovorax sp. GB3 TaxID=2719615 RepID=UPI002361C720|nr:hypothetical protein [Halobacteriovorax sp. GB3]MDD0852227.1 hypothetical protein [Halobacteriovorax sp. GB3]